MRLIGLAVMLTLSLVLTSLVAEAQQPEKVRRVVYLSGPTPAPANVETFRRALRENGYIEGRNLVIEWRSAEGKQELLPALAAELVGLKADVIVTESPSAALAAKHATAPTPIVFAFVSDPVALGLVASLARPGGNITGIANISAELSGKRLELLKDAIPSLKSVVVLTNPAASASIANTQVSPTIENTQSAARRLSLGVRLVEVRQLAELEPALSTIARERAVAVVLGPGPFFFTHQNQIAEIAIKRRLPVLGWVRPLAESGALMSYGADNAEILRRAASHVARILNGTPPADLPVEQPTKIDLVINLRTARALGLTIPQSLLLRANHVIE